MLKNKKMIKIVSLSLILSLCTPMFLATKSFGNEYNINYALENGLHEGIDEFYDLNNSSYDDEEVGSFENYYDNKSDEIIDFDNDYNYEDYNNPEDHEYDYGSSDNYEIDNNNNYDDYYDFSDFDFGSNNSNYYNPYTPDDFSFMDNIYDDYWGYENEKEEHIPGSKFLQTKNTLQYTLNRDEKYPIYVDTGIELVDSIISLEGLREVLSQIAIKKKAKLIEDSDKFMVLIDGELLIIKENVENERAIEELFEKTSVKVKIQPTRAGGKFNLADYIETNGNIPVKVNGEIIELITEPIVDNSKVLFPIRSIASAMDAEVKWNEEKAEAVVTKGDKVIKITSDSDKVIVNNVEYLISNNTKLNSEEQRLLSVIKLIVNELNGTVEWDSTNHTLVIETPQEKIDLDKDF